jgi:hypothetical protein
MVLRPVTTLFALFLVYLATPSTALADFLKSIVPPTELASRLGSNSTIDRCHSRDVALRTLARSKNEVGGRIVALFGGPDQSLADLWRGLFGKKPVAVSLILAHGFTRPPGSLEYVELIEFGIDGCALSWTFISGRQWNAIIGLLKGQAFNV